MDPSLPPSPGARPASARRHVEDLADRLGTSPAAIVVGAGVAVAAALAVVALVSWGGGSPPPELDIPYADGATTDSDAAAATGSSSSTTATPAAELLVHAAGAVARPGVYSLPPGSRVGDLVAAAGGPVGPADIDRLNLAARLTDGTRVYVPVLGEAAPPVVVGPVGSTPEDAPDGPLDINTADPGQLEELPGVGPATAAAIVAHREQHGPFRSVEDLLDVRGIGDAKLAALRDLVTV